MTSAGRRGLALAAVLLTAALVLVAVAATSRWVTLLPTDPDLPGSGRVPVRGSELVPAALPLALVGVAGLVAAVAAGRMARGVLRTAACVLIALAGVGLLALTVPAAADPGERARDLESARSASATVVSERSPIAWAAVGGGVGTVAAGLVALVAGRGWPGLTARYERDPSRPRAAAPASTWDAIERGDDPTR